MGLTPESPKDIKDYPQLQYGVNLFRGLLERPIFPELGYTQRQQDMVGVVTKALNTEPSVYTRPIPRATFNVDADWGSASVSMLRCGGYTLDGFAEWRDKREEGLEDWEKLIRVLIPSYEKLEEVPFPELPDLVVRLRLLPSTLVDDNTPESFVRFLYEGAEGTENRVRLYPWSKLYEFTGRYFNSVAIADVQSLSKDDSDILVVTDFYSKADRGDEMEVEDWKRLALFGIEGQGWIPFGRLSKDYFLQEELV